MTRTTAFLGCIALVVNSFAISTAKAESAAEWALVDSLSFQTLIHPGQRVVISFDAKVDSLSVTAPLDNLTDLAKQAIRKAPVWLKWDLQDTFARIKELYPPLKKFKPERHAVLTDSIVNTFASLIMEAQDPIVDEVAFQVAHIAPELLSEMVDYSALLMENAQYVYRNDEYLDYAQVVDYGTCSDEDYYSTAKYRLRTAEGDTVEYELPREYYYWYVVHPVLSRETPVYFRPASCTTSVFWRQYLFNESEPGYPVLKDRIAGCQTLWNSLVNVDSAANGAVGIVSQWVQDSVEWGTPNPRSRQPLEIYKLHRGRCGEWSYITAAAARSALIPTTSSLAYANDHIWNEFWAAGRWVQWEPVNTFVHNPGSYERWGWKFPAVFNFRGDGYIWPITGRYTETGKLQIEVRDTDGNPVDDARVSLYAPHRYEGWGIWFCGALYTDRHGQCEFAIGDSLDYYVRVESPVGEVSRTKVITNSAPGQQYDWSCNLPGRLSRLSVNPVAEPSADGQYMAEISFQVPYEIVYGYGFPKQTGEFAKKVYPGAVESFVCDAENYRKYLAGSNFDAFEVQHNISSGSFSVNLSRSNTYHFVLSNEGSFLPKQYVSAVAKLYKKHPTLVASTTVLPPPQSFFLSQNYPNPFNCSTLISYRLPTAAYTKLNIYDIGGRLVRTFVNAYQQPGCYSVRWDGKDSFGRDVASGVYIYRLVAGTLTSSRKLVVVR